MPASSDLLYLFMCRFLIWFLERFALFLLVLFYFTVIFPIHSAILAVIVAVDCIVPEVVKEQAAYFVLT